MGISTHEARYKYVSNVVVPYVNAVARYSDPAFNRAVLYVAQYWNDEAEEAVHNRMLFFEDGPAVTLDMRSLRSQTSRDWNCSLASGPRLRPMPPSTGCVTWRARLLLDSGCHT